MKISIKLYWYGGCLSSDNPHIIIILRFYFVNYSLIIWARTNRFGLKCSSNYLLNIYVKKNYGLFIAYCQVALIEKTWHFEVRVKHLDIQDWYGDLHFEKLLWFIIVKYLFQNVKGVERNCFLLFSNCYGHFLGN